VRAVRPAGPRLSSAVAVVAVLAVVALVIVWATFGGGRQAGLPAPDGHACVAAPGGEQRDADPDDSPEAPWPHVRGERVLVDFAVGGLPARYAGLVDRAAALWARSPCVEPVVVDACRAGSRCSTIVAREQGRDDHTDAESESDDRRGVRRSNIIILYTALLDRESDNGALATIVHEMGHTFGLVHRKDGDSVMNAETDDSTNPVPDAVDFANLVVLYG
jgi:hypothetical protein